HEKLSCHFVRGVSWLWSRRCTTDPAQCLAPRVHGQARPWRSRVSGRQSRENAFCLRDATVWPRRKDRRWRFPSSDETGDGEPYWSAQVCRRGLGPRREDNGLSHPLPGFRRDESHLRLIFPERKLSLVHH